MLNAARSSNVTIRPGSGNRLARVSGIDGDTAGYKLVVAVTSDYAEQACDVCDPAEASVALLLSD